MAESLEDEAFHLIRRVMQEHTARWQTALPELTKPQYSLLRAAYEQPDIDQADLTHAAASTKATIAEMLVRLERRGLVVRQVDHHDRRRRFVTLTEEGRTTLEGARERAQEVDQAWLGRLSPGEQDELVRLLKKAATA